MANKKHYNSLLNLIIPAILINLVTGSVYCWSLLSKAVMDTFTCTKFQADISFSLAIFFLGMSGAVFGTIIIQTLLSHFNLFGTFLIMALIYFIPMMTSTLMFKKIPFKLQDNVKQEKIIDILKTKKYIAIWFMFFANISCGLAFIANEAPMLRTFGFGMVAISIISSMSSVFNSLGRFGFAALSDWKGREYAYFVIFGLSIIACLFNLSYVPVIFVIALMMINMGYGGGFSSLPALITKHYGISKTSTIHGLTLSAWGIAGLVGPMLANVLSYQSLLFVLAGIYGISLISVKKFVR